MSYNPDHFDAEIQSEEIFDHDPDECCSGCANHITNCICNVDLCSQCGSDCHGCRCADYGQLWEDQYLDMCDDNPVMGFDY